MHIVMLGPQGSGKGTQAQRLAERFRLVHIETGSILRAVSKQNTVLGKKVDRLMNVLGQLVPDAVVVKALRSAVDRVPRGRGIVFDGYPRTLVQAKLLERMLRATGRSLTHAIYMPLSQSTTIHRLSRRRTCQECRTPWILGKNLRRGVVRCPKCGGRVVQREDDKPATIKKRLAEYNKKTAPVVKWYRQRGVLIEVNGEPTIDEVWRELKAIIR